MGLGRVELPTSRLSVRKYESPSYIPANKTAPSHLTLYPAAKTRVIPFRQGVNSAPATSKATPETSPGFFAKVANWLQTAKTGAAAWLELRREILRARRIRTRQLSEHEKAALWYIVTGSR
jgi:hypothetical protein